MRPPVHRLPGGHLLRNLGSHASEGSNFQRLRPFLVVVYMIAVCSGFLYFNFRLTIEWVAVILFTAALMYGKGMQFLRDWSVFIVVLLAWQFTSPLATQFGFPWHLQELIDADKLLLAGQVAPVWLQAHLHHKGVLEPWDVAAAVLYMSHFVTPLLCGFALWITNRELFRKFAIAFVLLALGGFITYILYPSVPPHLASQPLIHTRGIYMVAAGGHVYLPGAENLFQTTIGHWFSPYHGYVSLTWQGMDFLKLKFDPVAEIPSEHAAFPVLFYLFLRRQFGWPAHAVLLYVAAVLFAILYLGMHYFIDAVIGYVYAISAYVIVMHVAPATLVWLRQSLSSQHIPQPATGQE